MKFKGIIPEVKMSEATLEYNKIIKRLKPYKVISVNTSSLFGGDLGLLKYIRAKYPKKFLIRKDFIMIPRQIKESKEAGANAVLIIRDFLDTYQYEKLIDSCKENKIIPITEISYFNFEENLQSPVLVNSRDLNTENIDYAYAEDICSLLKKRSKNIIYASGENSDRVIKEGIADAVLIGTAFVKDKFKEAKE